MKFVMAVFSFASLLSLSAGENLIRNGDFNQNHLETQYLKNLKSFKDELTLYEPKKTYNNENIVNEHKEEIDNNYEKDDENEFIENRMRNNSNMSYASSLYDEKVIKDMVEVVNRKSEEYGHPIYIVSDEPYRELLFDGQKYPFITNFSIYT